MVNEKAVECKLVARPWEPQDLLDDLQLMIDEEPDRYLNDRRTTLCMARDYLKEYFDAKIGTPLTVADLKEMPLNEWVWIQILGVNGKRRVYTSESSYYRKDHSCAPQREFQCGLPGLSAFFDYEDYGKTWVAYKYKLDNVSG